MLVITCNGKEVYRMGKTYPDPSEKPTSKQAESTDASSDPICEICKHKLVPYPDGKGKTVSVNKHRTGSMEKFGHIFCVDCIKKIQDEGVME